MSAVRALTRAEHATDCAECGRPIEPDELVSSSGDESVHEACTADADDYDDDYPYDIDDSFVDYDGC